MKVGLVAVALMLSAAACTSLGPRPAPGAAEVSRWVGALTVSGPRQEEAVERLLALGESAVPHLVGHLDDMRPLAVEAISLENGADGAFEGVRHYAPRTVHDALDAMLNELTGETFEHVVNGASVQVREHNRRQWVDWCERTYPAQARVCRGEAGDR